MNSSLLLSCALHLFTTLSVSLVSSAAFCVPPPPFYLRAFSPSRFDEERQEEWWLVWFRGFGLAPLHCVTFDILAVLYSAVSLEKQRHSSGSSMRRVAAILLLLAGVSHGFMPSLPTPAIARRLRASVSMKVQKQPNHKPQKIKTPTGVEVDVSVEDLKGAWSSTGGRSKSWFEEEERKRREKVSPARRSDASLALLGEGACQKDYGGPSTQRRRVKARRVKWEAVSEGHHHPVAHIQCLPLGLGTLLAKLPLTQPPLPPTTPPLVHCGSIYSLPPSPRHYNNRRKLHPPPPKRLQRQQSGLVLLLPRPAPTPSQPRLLGLTRLLATRSCLSMYATYSCRPRKWQTT